MKSIVSKNEKLIVPVTFPCVMEYLGDNHSKASEGIIVMFFSEVSGVCLNPGTSNRKVGEFLNNWHNANDYNAWKPFRGTITIEV